MVEADAVFGGRHDRTVVVKFLGQNDVLMMYLQVVRDLAISSESAFRVWLSSFQRHGLRGDTRRVGLPGDDG